MDILLAFTRNGRVVHGPLLAPCKRSAPPRRDHGHGYDDVDATSRCAWRSVTSDAVVQVEHSALGRRARSSSSSSGSSREADRAERSAAADSANDRLLLADLARWISNAAALGRSLNPGHLVEECSSGVVLVRLTQAVLTGVPGARCGCDESAAPLSKEARSNFAIVRQLLHHSAHAAAWRWRGDSDGDGDGASRVGGAAEYSFDDALAGDLARLVSFLLETLAALAWSTKSLDVPRTLRFVIASSPRWRLRQSRSAARASAGPRGAATLSPDLAKRIARDFSASRRRSLLATVKRRLAPDASVLKGVLARRGGGSGDASENARAARPRLEWKGQASPPTTPTFMRNVITGAILPIEAAIKSPDHGSCWRLLDPATESRKKKGRSRAASRPVAPEPAPQVAPAHL